MVFLSFVNARQNIAKNTKRNKKILSSSATQQAEKNDNRKNILNPSFSGIIMKIGWFD